MFWNRKNKKKDVEEAEAGGTTPSTVTADGADDADGPRDEPQSAEDKGADTAATAVAAEETPAATDAATDADAEKPAKAGETDAEAKAEEAGEAEAGEKAEAKAEGATEEEREPEVPGTDEPDSDGIQRVRTAGVLKVDGEEYDVVSNTWIVDVDDEGVVVIDPAHDAKAVLEAVGEREIYLVACTNGYNTHIGAAVEVAERDQAPIALHRREIRPWRRVHGAEHRPDLEVEGGGSLQAGDKEIDILPLPGTSTGSVAYYISELGAVFSGDTLRKGELGTVGEGYVDYTRQLHSVGEVLMSLPPDTRILPDRGPETTVAAESKNFETWV
ncbi:glyoxylase-like metal-dependent hydrolase (beta-lactamase superfamily II) [Nocardiopsis mwathae]|uniref:Glyoxylase-like metal-dependent hydrolase (Beta-lactamase superfamily II) n=1 Tax=Nocardiopsis mwathae TaxID=1472723 RepID=A0A7W9YJG4_9ACTN|nr:glyoxylase-like metal-dependent hydrolase (beta-lactamase superfamily II) [Nocardiopsis mwathae]